MIDDEKIKQDAARYRWLRDNRGRTNSPKMDGTFVYSLFAHLPRALTFDDAVDTLMRESLEK